MLPLVERYELADGRQLNLLARGRVVNLAAGQGHPPAAMDMSFANLALAVEHLVLHGAELEPRVLDVPKQIDEEIARLKLDDARRRDRRADARPAGVPQLLGDAGPIGGWPGAPAEPVGAG